MRVLYTAEAPVPEIPYFETTFNNRLVTKMPLTKAQFFEAATVASTGSLKVYEAPEHAVEKGNTGSATQPEPAETSILDSALTRFLRSHYAAQTVESVAAALLRHGRIIEIVEFDRGSAFKATIGDRKLAQRGLEADATAVILAHNHVADTAAPSLNDILATRHFAITLQALHIELLDHLIIADGEVSSLKSLGYIPDAQSLLLTLYDAAAD